MDLHGSKVENPTLWEVWLLRKTCANVALHAQAHTSTCLRFLPLESESRKQEVRSKNEMDFEDVNTILFIRTNLFIKCILYLFYIFIYFIYICIYKYIYIIFKMRDVMAQLSSERIRSY